LNSIARASKAGGQEFFTIAIKPSSLIISNNKSESAVFYLCDAQGRQRYSGKLLAFSSLYIPKEVLAGQLLSAVIVYSSKSKMVRRLFVK